ncbi:hypothetical protein DAPPUDRAFT_258661 [Daphnia pulex]|uniref:Uncharacterized protein n=1 Tax=Daphnia pulex TaxID=6669 RepID=E9HFU0_DAPPU|nr:hypothetical protein DAPPUDRAFT_258661 [Daphnia pulex]|eukprot:EFX69409.1 hypothetical protein DAPPUDRAFT_258661 [Daphnia pulex]
MFERNLLSGGVVIKRSKEKKGLVVKTTPDHIRAAAQSGGRSCGRSLSRRLFCASANLPPPPRTVTLHSSTRSLRLLERLGSLNGRDLHDEQKRSAPLSGGFRYLCSDVDATP